MGLYRGCIGIVDGGLGFWIRRFGVRRRVSCQCGGVVFLTWEPHGIIGGGALDRCVYGPLDACFQSGAELRVAARFFAIQFALHEDKLGDGAHPGFTDAE